MIPLLLLMLTTATVPLTSTIIGILRTMITALHGIIRGMETIGTGITGTGTIGTAIAGAILGTIGIGAVLTTTIIIAAITTITIPIGMVTGTDIITEAELISEVTMFS